MSVKYTESQLYQIQTVYEIMARLIPTEGRDYNIEFGFNNKDNPNEMSVSFKPHNEIGKFWCSYCSKVLSKFRSKK